MAWLAPLLVFVLLAAPTARLARMAGAAERSVAGFFLTSATGLSLRMLAVTDGAVDSTLEILQNLIGHAALSASCVALFVFTRAVFRPTERWALSLLRGGTVASALVFGAVLLDGGLQSEDAGSVLLANALRTASYSWCFLEALRYWKMMRRRVEMGIAEPVVANRFGLWCIWTGGLTGCLAFVLAGRLLGRVFGLGTQAFPVAILVAQVAILTGIVASAVAIWLSFFPPSRYLDWIDQRATRDPA